MDEMIDFLKSRQPVNLAMVFINIIVFLVLGFMGNPENVEFMLNHGAAFAPLIAEGHEYYRLLTCMFLHFGMEHLINNMLVLIFLGDILEQMVGKVRYFLIYIGGGIAGNILSVAWAYRTEDFTVSAGASGAVFAVIGALVFLVIRSRGKSEELSGKRLIFMAGLSVLQGFTSMGIDNMAHVGGLAAGFLIALLTGAGKRNAAYRA